MKMEFYIRSKNLGKKIELQQKCLILETPCTIYNKGPVNPPWLIQEIVTSVTLWNRVHADPIILFFIDLAPLFITSQLAARQFKILSGQCLAVGK